MQKSLQVQIYYYTHTHLITKRVKIMTTKTTTKNTKGLRDALFEQLDGLRNGTTTPQQAKAVSSIASQIVSVTKLEMEAARFVVGAGQAADEIKAIKTVKL